MPMTIFELLFRLTRKVVNSISACYDKIATTFIFKGNGVSYSTFRTTGIPYVVVATGGMDNVGRMLINKDLSINNGIKENPIGSYRRCTFFVDRGATLTIGKHVGLSQTALICHLSITIGDYVKMGAGVSVFDTDFHSLDPDVRKSSEDMKHKAKAPVVIHDNVFIGAHSIILKGVTIGRNSIIGAGSVVTKSIPENQIWAGNPAKYIRNV